jgi:hypothetical protein
MPIVSEVVKTPRGVRYFRAESSGPVSGGDAHSMMDPLRVGAEHHDLALLAVVADGSDFTPEARKVFGANDPERNAKNIPTALVVRSAPLRVMMGFVFRMAGASDRSRVFANEVDAKEWLFPKIEV